MADEEIAVQEPVATQGQESATTTPAPDVAQEQTTQATATTTATATEAGYKPTLDDIDRIEKLNPGAFRKHPTINKYSQSIADKRVAEEKRNLQRAQQESTQGQQFLNHWNSATPQQQAAWINNDPSIGNQLEKARAMAAQNILSKAQTDVVANKIWSGAKNLIASDKRSEDIDMDEVEREAGGDVSEALHMLGNKIAERQVAEERVKMKDELEAMEARLMEQMANVSKPEDQPTVTPGGQVGKDQVKFTTSQIKNMSTAEFQKNMSAIDAASRAGLISNK